LKMLSVSRVDAVLQRLKGLERWWYGADYRHLAATLRSLEGDGWRRYRERLLPGMPAPEAVRSVLVFKPDEIGDAIHALPAVARLKDHYREAAFFLICQPATRPIYARTELFDHIGTADVKMRLFRFPVLDVPAVLAQLATQARHAQQALPGPAGFDLTVFLRTYPAYFRHYLQVPGRHRLHPLDPRMPSSSPLKAPVSLWGDRRAHQARQLMEIVALLTGDRDAPLVDPPFHWREADREKVRRVCGGALSGALPDSYVVVHPFARYETRRYPHWPQILRWLEQRYGCAVVVIGGREDAGDRETYRRYHQLQGELSLAASGYLISRARAFLGNESGPAHWAGALGVPTVTFFGGHSGPDEWAPRGNTLLLTHPVPCAPCHRRACPGYGVKCLAELTPDTVYPRLEKFLDGALGGAGAP
jgi:ADP-heptose:LPS heptosyltransferase